MRIRILGSLLAFGVSSAVVASVPVAAAGQAPKAAAKTTASAKTWTPPRTADGQPDLQGIWDNHSITPLERPAEFAGREFLTPEEAALLEKQAVQSIAAIDNRD